MGVSKDIAGTLRAEEHGHQPIVFSAGFDPQMGAKAQGIAYEQEIAPTLTAQKVHAILKKRLFENHGQDSRLKGTLEVAPTVSRKFGTGRNNTPLVYSQQKFGDYREEKVAATMTAHNGTRHTGEVLAVMPTAIRRLTPLECERLQGYPDRWTVLQRIEDMSDAGYEFWKVVLLEKAEREGKARISEDGIWEIWSFIPSENEDEEGRWENTHKPYKHKTKKQMVAWYNRSFCENTDSARYKAMGNSIALPSWRWVLKRISAMYEREATMASLFDGVGGFPMIWEQINGKGSCLWASEIELFPIAVTRYRFGDEA